MIPRAVFLDKDGTLIINVPYNVDPDQIVLCPGAAEGLRLLHDAGYKLIIVSNQSGVARGYFAEKALGPVRERLEVLLQEIGVPLTGFYYCPHHPLGSVPAYSITCSCRKPAPGLVLCACQELGIDPAQSWLIGDLLDDIRAGRAAGCRTILLSDRPREEPDYTATDLTAAAQIILSRSESSFT